MGSFAKHMILCQTNLNKSNYDHHNPRHYQHHHGTSAIISSAKSNLHEEIVEWKEPPLCDDQFNLKKVMQRRRMGVASVSAIVVAASAMVEAGRPPAPLLRPPPAQAAEMSWGTRSFIKEKYFQPGLTPEEAVARIRQTTEGLREMRHMLDTMSWRYVMFYIRLKSAYLDADLKNALATLPESRRKSYIKTANEVVDYMSELDRYVRSPKVYESYLYYEKTLKSLDELVAILA